MTAPITGTAVSNIPTSPLGRLARFGELAWQDVRHGFRALRLRPGYAATVAITLALGMGVNAAIFGVLDRLLFRAPEHIAEPDRLVQIHTGRLGSDMVQTSQSYALHTHLRQRVPDFQSVAVVTPQRTGSRQYYPLGRGATAWRVTGAQVSPSFFTVMGVRPYLGRFFQEDEAGEANPGKLAVVSHGFWRRHFGGRRDAIGAHLDIGTDRYTVVGVAPPGFRGAEITDVDVWLPIASAEGLRFIKGPHWSTTRQSTWLHIFARLAPGATRERALGQASRAVREFQRVRDAESPARSRAESESVTVMFGSVIPGESLAGLGPSGHTDLVQVSRLLGVVALFVLLLACANVANLLLVRAINRQREIAVRLALGVSRARLTSQLLLEGLLLAAFGGIGALVIAFLASGVMRRLLLADAAWAGAAVDGRLLAATAIMTVGVAVVTSLLPIVQASRPELTRELKSGAREGLVQRSFTRSTLLATQTALALVLLTGAGLFLKSLQRAMRLPFGVDVDRVVLANIDHATVGMSNAAAGELYLRFVERARMVPGVSAAAASIAHSFGLGWGTSVYWRGESLRLNDRTFAQYAITPDYFTVMGIRLSRGRAFTATDRAGSPLVAIVNETAAQTFWPRGDAVGQCVQVGADSVPCTTIVGVVTNARRQQLLEDPIPQIYRPLIQLPESATRSTVSTFGMTLLARAERPSAVVEPLRRALQATAPDVPYAHVRPLAEQVGRHTRSWELGAKMFSVFGALALAIAAIGLYSVVLFTMVQRRHEYGVRLALGASARHLVWITMLRGLLPALAGLVGGAALALAGAKIVASLLFQTTPTDPIVIGTTCAILLAAAAIACLLPGLRAARTDPLVALRAD
jgi:predicted permease